MSPTSPYLVPDNMRCNAKPQIRCEVATGNKARVEAGDDISEALPVV
jgi:hypothetical protein